MEDARIEAHGACGRITLNRPRALNALTLEMVREIHRALTDWAADDRVEFVLIDGAGDRGLCAGGDIRALYGFAVAQDFRAAADFFREEYRLNSLIAHYPKPYLALMDGIVMGGGIGISAHGSHRIVTERSSLAMPETGIGFVPDVGATFLLSRAPDELGTYLGLCGGRIGAADAIACGLADLFVPSERLPALAAQLAGVGRADFKACLKTYAEAPPAGSFETRRAWIRECFSHSSVEVIVEALEREPEAAETAAEIRKQSPTALKVTLEALRRARSLPDLDACLRQEYVVSLNSMRFGDFVEGVRAAVIDKDRNPRWDPAHFQDVTAERVEACFAPFEGEQTAWPE